MTAGEWNQALSYQQLVSRMPLKAREKKKLQALLRSKGMSQQKPVPVEYLPTQRRFAMQFSGGEQSVWVFAIAPSVIVYDGNKITEVAHKSTLDQLLASREQTSQLPLKSNTPGKGRGAWLWQLLVPESQAQLYTNEQIVAMEKQNQQLAKQQTSLAQTLLIIAGVAFGGFLVGSYLWNKYADRINPNWGLAGKQREREARMAYTRNKDVLKAQFPELEQVLFGGEERLRYFECTEDKKPNQPRPPSPVRRVSFEKNGQPTREFQFKDHPEERDKIMAGSDNYAKMVERVNYCCQTPPCDEWLNYQFTGDNPRGGAGPGQGGPSGSPNGRPIDPPPYATPGSAGPANPANGSGHQ